MSSTIGNLTALSYIAQCDLHQQIDMLKDGEVFFQIHHSMTEYYDWDTLGKVILETVSKMKEQSDMKTLLEALLRNFPSYCLMQLKVRVPKLGVLINDLIINDCIQSESVMTRKIFGNPSLDCIKQLCSADANLQLVNIFANLHLFKYRDLDEHEKNEFHRFLVANIGDIGSLSVVPSIHQFRHHFSVITEKLLDGLDWDHMVCAGGSVLACLMAKPWPISTSMQQSLETYYRESIYKHSDIDMYFYALDEEECERRISKVYDIILKNSGGPILCIRTKNAITFSCGYPRRNIQIITKLFATKAHIVYYYDLDSCCVLYDGTSVFALPRAIRALNTRYNIVDTNFHRFGYESRLVKYSYRGFGIALRKNRYVISSPADHGIADPKSFEIDPRIDHIIKTYPKKSLRRFATLISLLREMDPKKLDYNNNFPSSKIPEDRTGFPYGPDWDIPKLYFWLKKQTAKLRERVWFVFGYELKDVMHIEGYPWSVKDPTYELLESSELDPNTAWFEELAFNETGQSVLLNPFSYSSDQFQAMWEKCSDVVEKPTKENRTVLSDIQKQHQHLEYLLQKAKSVDESNALASFLAANVWKTASNEIDSILDQEMNEKEMENKFVGKSTDRSSLLECWTSYLKKQNLAHEGAFKLQATTLQTNLVPKALTEEQQALVSAIPDDIMSTSEEKPLQSAAQILEAMQDWKAKLESVFQPSIQKVNELVKQLTEALEEEQKLFDQHQEWLYQGQQLVVQSQHLLANLKQTKMELPKDTVDNNSRKQIKEVIQRNHEQQNYQRKVIEELNTILEQLNSTSHSKIKAQFNGLDLKQKLSAVDTPTSTKSELESLLEHQQGTMADLVQQESAQKQALTELRKSQPIADKLCWTLENLISPSVVNNGLLKLVNIEKDVINTLEANWYDKRTHATYSVELKSLDNKSEVDKMIWDYIKKSHMNSVEDRKQILFDGTRLVFVNA